jgi:hypothetical protein
VPVSSFLAAVPPVYFAARRLGGAGAAMVAVLLFATSPLASGFGAQIRGYSPSWLMLAVASWAAFACLHDERRRWRLVYVLSAAAAVATVPSNLYLALVLAVGVAAGAWTDSARSRPSATRLSAWLLAGPLLGLIAYAGIYAELGHFAAIDLSAWTRAGLLREWLRVSFADAPWLMLPAGAGLAAGAWALGTARRGTTGTRIPQLAVALATLLAFVAMLWMVPRVPFPRTLTPFLPLWCSLLGLLISVALECLLRRRLAAVMLLGAMPWVALLASGSALPACRAASNGGPGGYDLCYQFFHDRYHPEALVEAWRLLGDPSLPLVADYEGFYALRVLGVPDLQVQEYRSYAGARAPAIVVAGPGDLERIATTIGVEPQGYRMLADTGYFKLYVAPAP